jgi:hypothetical protein
MRPDSLDRPRPSAASIPAYMRESTARPPGYPLHMHGALSQEPKPFSVYIKQQHKKQGVTHQPGEELFCNVIRITKQLRPPTHYIGLQVHAYLFPVCIHLEQHTKQLNIRSASSRAPTGLLNSSDLLQIWLTRTDFAVLHRRASLSPSGSFKSHFPLENIH